MLSCNFCYSGVLDISNSWEIKKNKPIVCRYSRLACKMAPVPRQDPESTPCPRRRRRLPRRRGRCTWRGPRPEGRPVSGNYLAARTDRSRRSGRLWDPWKWACPCRSIGPRNRVGPPTWEGVAPREIAPDLRTRPDYRAAWSPHWSRPFWRWGDDLMKAELSFRETLNSVDYRVPGIQRSPPRKNSLSQDTEKKRKMNFNIANNFFSFKRY